jgi:CRISPR system Cascade subunit CasA
VGYATLDGPYRQWLAGLGETSDPQAHRAQWQETVGAQVRALGRRFLDGAGPAAAEGRYVDLPDGDGRRWLNDAQAELWFLARLKKVLPLAPRPAAEPLDAPATPHDSTAHDTTAHDAATELAR